MEEASPALAPPNAETVGNAFVVQYYNVLHRSPDFLYKFYQDLSVLSWSDSNGVMTPVTTVQAINDKILSSDYKNSWAEIKTMDVQESYNKGVIVVVTGCSTGKDNVKRKFTQTFFLAPQETCYIVLNDVFRYIDESESLEISSVSADGINENASTAYLPYDPDPCHSPKYPVLDPATTFEAKDLINGAKVCALSDKEEGSALLDKEEESVLKQEVVDEVSFESAKVFAPSDEEEGSVLKQEVIEELPVHSSPNDINSSVSSDIPAVQVEKKSYASIVKEKKVVKPATLVYVPTGRARPVPPNPNQQCLGSPKPSPEPAAAGPTNALDNKGGHEEVKGHSIYVRNLSVSVTVAQLEEVFKKFGPIKRDGVQVRTNQQGFCFGFVEFESSGSVQDAIKASPLTIGGRAAVVEEKRTQVSNSGRGRYTTGSGRSGPRNDSFGGGRGNFGGAGRGHFARGEYRNRGEFSGRPNSNSGRGGENYRRVDQNGSVIDGPAKTV